jgi:hypothetical protein
VRFDHHGHANFKLSDATEDFREAILAAAVAAAAAGDELAHANVALKERRAALMANAESACMAVKAMTKRVRVALAAAEAAVLSTLDEWVGQKQGTLAEQVAETEHALERITAAVALATVAAPRAVRRGSCRRQPV